MTVVYAVTAAILMRGVTHAYPHRVIGHRSDSVRSFHASGVVALLAAKTTIRDVEMAAAACGTRSTIRHVAAGPQDRFWRKLRKPCSLDETRARDSRSDPSYRRR